MEKYNETLWIYKTLATCPSTSKIVGDNVVLTVNITQGTAPYIITYKKDGITLGTPVTAATIGSYYYTYTTTSDDAGTSPIFTVNVVDNCSTPNTFTDQCTVIISAACQPPICSFTVT